MTESHYRLRQSTGQSRKNLAKWVFAVFAVLLLAAVLYKIFAPSPIEQAVNKLNFDNSVAAGEQQTIKDAITAQSKTYDGSTDVSVKTVLEQSGGNLTLAAYVPVTHAYSVRQSVTQAELTSLPLWLPSDTDPTIKSAIASLLGIDEAKINPWTGMTDLADTDIALLPAGQLDASLKLLKLGEAYYLDSFSQGAVFRQAEFSGEAAQALSDLKLNNLPTKESVLKFNQTGVTALTRLMMRMLARNNNPLYFSEDIGSFLADADITHISNEVSFKAGCGYSDTLFCSDPRFIETLKASGVDLVELTGNHNNDLGSVYNTETINLYHSLGWATVGGGLNAAEAAKPYMTDQKGTKLAVLAYNYPDSPNGGAIAGPDKAGANSFNFDRIKTDIEAAKAQANYVIVDVQFWECYAYPDGYAEFPQCDGPIPNQASVFKQIADLGANMVVGTSAHQPQTYEIYNGSAIYYGLGNLYFDQDRWPGTERGVILTHYFSAGKLLQTKLTPTVYNKDYQTRLMNAEEAEYLLTRLKAAR